MNQYYRGGWLEGKMSGYGEYIWKGFFNKHLAFPLQNTYRGEWKEGKRTGKGSMIFGTESGARLDGHWDQDFKHGDGHMVCGNGISIQQHCLFSYDKPSHFSSASSIKDHVTKVPIFTIAENVDMGYYIDKVLEKIENYVEPNKLYLLKMYEEANVRNTITLFLPQLEELYKKYASLAVKVKLNFDPILPRIFLWQLYKDVDIKRFGLSLIDTDNILKDNPKNCLETDHNPFEKIYFWQFLMSLMGVALATCSLEDTVDNMEPGGVSAFIFKKFLQKCVFNKIAVDTDHISIKFFDMVPLKAAYALYLELGEPHTARDFLRHTCLKKGQEVPCYFDRRVEEQGDLNFGRNTVPLDQEVAFISGKYKLLTKMHKTH